MPVLLPRNWVNSSSRLRVNLTATSVARAIERAAHDRCARPVRLEARDRRHDADRGGADRARGGEGAAHPRPRALARTAALRGGEGAAVPRAPPRGIRGRSRPRGLRASSSRTPGSSSATSSLDDALSALLDGGDERHYEPLGTPAAMTQPLFPFQERGHGWLRLLGDLGIGAILADDMGLGKTVQAIAMLTSEREQFGAEAFGPTLVVCPMSVTRQWAREIERFAPSLRVHLHHGGERLDRRRAGRGRPLERRRDHLVRHRHPRHRDALADPLGPAAARRGAGRQEPRHQAGTRAAPARCAPHARDDGHPDREPARRALGDHGHRQPRPARLTRAVPAQLRAADRGERRLAGARAAAGDGAAVHPAAAEGQPRGRARAAEDHGHEGVLQAHPRAGEPLPGDRRPLDAADRGARAQLRPPRRRARDARPAEAGVQPPGDGARDRPAARRPLRQARAPRRAARGDAAPTTRRSSSRSTPASTGSCRTCTGGSAARSASSTAAWPRVSATSSSRRSPIPTGRRCS